MYSEIIHQPPYPSPTSQRRDLAVARRALEDLAAHHGAVEGGRMVVDVRDVHGGVDVGALRRHRHQLVEVALQGVRGTRCTGAELLNVFGHSNTSTARKRVI